MLEYLLKRCIFLPLLSVAFFIATVAIYNSDSFAQENDSEILGIRFGLQKNISRCVIDLKKKVPFSTSVSDDGKIITIKLPNTVWNDQKNNNVSKYSLVKKYRFEEGSLILEMKRPSIVKKSFILGADIKSGKKNHRLIIDLKEGRAKSNSKTTIKKDVKNNIKKNIKKKEPVVTRKPSRPIKKRLIVIDAGHGGIDPGAIGRTGVKEKKITLQMARALRKELEQSGRYNVILTRNKDIYLKLKARRNIAHKKEADLFISLHADIIKNRRLRGASVYTLSEKSSDDVSAALARSENKVDLITGVDLSDESEEVTNILIDLAQRETMNLSAEFASEVIRSFKKSNIKLLRNTHRFAGFAVLKSVDVPSVLIELGFLSNLRDSKLLVKPSHQRKTAVSLRKSIDAYFRNKR